MRNGFISQFGIKILIFSIIFLCLGIGVTTFSASGANYYVRPAGSGGLNTGTSYANAWLGFGNINWTTLASGANTLFVAGTHTGTMTIGQSGEDGQKIRIVSCEQQYGASTEDSGIITAGQIYGNYKSYIYIRGLEMKYSVGINQPFNWDHAIYNYGGSRWDILDCDFHHNSGDGDVYLNGSGGYHNVQNNNFTSTGLGVGSSTGQGFGLGIDNNPNSTIKGNYFDEAGAGSGIGIATYLFYLGNSCNNSVVEGNYFKLSNGDNGSPMIYIRASVGFQVYNVKFKNNVVVRGDGGTDTPLLGYHGVNFKIYNNLFIGGAYIDDCVNTIIKNNIFINGNFYSQTSGDGGTLDYNLYYNCVRGDVSGITVGNHEIGGASLPGVNPQFVASGNIPSPYYRPQSTSPARNSGINDDADIPNIDYDGVARPQQSVKDIGPFEYASGVTTKTTTPTTTTTTTTLIRIKPHKTTVKVSKKKTFKAKVKGKGDFREGFEWYVNDILGGNSIIGTIIPRKDGKWAIYKAPSIPPNPGTIIIKIKSRGDSSGYGTAEIMIKNNDQKEKMRAQSGSIPYFFSRS